MRYRKNLPQNSKRLAKTMLKALNEHDRGEQNVVMLDCYNDKIFEESVAITTRIDACNHYYIMSVYEILDIH